MCGEKVIRLIRDEPELGSPPRVRGKVDYGTQNAFAARITPACAGKRRTQHYFRCIPQDHPRVCGEKALPRYAATSSGGSPPRVRGKGQAENFLPVILRITPACAGKSYDLQDERDRD